MLGYINYDGKTYYKNEIYYPELTQYESFWACNQEDTGFIYVGY